MSLAILRFNKHPGCAYNLSINRADNWPTPPAPSVRPNGALFTQYKAPHLYVLDQGNAGNSRINTWDMGNPFVPALVAEYALPLGSRAQCFKLNPEGDKLYVPCFGATVANQKLIILSLANPLALAQLGELTISEPGGGGGTIGPSSVAILPGGIAACGTGNVTTWTNVRVNATNPAAPFREGQYRYDAAGNYGGYMLASPVANEFYALNNRGNSGTAALFIRLHGTTFAKTGELSGGVLFENCVLGAAITSDGQYVYTPLNGGNNLWAVYVGGAGNPTGVKVPMTQTGTMTGSLNGVCIVEGTNRVYVGRANGGGLCIPIMDITNRAVPVVSGKMTTQLETCNDICTIPDMGCFGFAWVQGTGAAVNLRGTPPISGTEVP